MGSLTTFSLQEDNLRALLNQLSPSQQNATGLPVPNATHSFWIDSPGANPLAKEGSEGDLPPDADVCIIGSGITGISAAYHLAKKLSYRRSVASTTRVTILEARDFCSGATGRNGGHLTPELIHHFAALQQLYGTAETKKMYELERYTATELINIIEAENLQDVVNLVHTSHVNLLMTENELKGSQTDFAAAKSAGVDLKPLEWLSREEVKETYGASYPAWKFPAHNLWPLKLVTQLYKLALRRNSPSFQLAVHTNTPVTSISSSSSTSRRWSLSTPRGDVQCSYVIHATNGYASHLLKHMHGPSGIVPTRGQVMAIRAAAPAAEITGVSWDANVGFEYWFPRPAKQSEEPLIILGGGRESCAPGFETYTTDDSVVRKEVGKTLREFLPAMFPGKYEQGREPEMEWTGIMGYTRIGDPFVGPVLGPHGSRNDEFQGQYISAGYTGHGMPRAYACAEVVAGMVAADMTGDRWVAPEWLPRHFLTTERIKFE